MTAPNVVGPEYLAPLLRHLDSAAKLLQHDSKKITADHYRNKPEKLRAVR